MSRYYTGEKPCAGCGRSGKENPRWGANEICHNCNDYIKLGKGVKEDCKDGGFSSICLSQYNLKRVKKVDHRKGWDDGGHSERGDRFNYVGATGEGREIDRELRNKLQELLEVINEGVKENCDFFIYCEDSWNENAVFVKTEVALTFFEFMKTLADYSRLSYEDGLNRGRNYVYELASGQKTLGDFEKRGY